MLFISSYLMVVIVSGVVNLDLLVRKCYFGLMTEGERSVLALYS